MRCRPLERLTESVGETSEELEFLDAKPRPPDKGAGSGNDTVSEEGVSGTELVPLAEEECPVVDGQEIRPLGFDKRFLGLAVCRRRRRRQIRFEGRRNCLQACSIRDACTDYIILKMP